MTPPAPSDPDLAARLEDSFRHTQRLVQKLEQPGSSKFKRPRFKFKTKLAVKAAQEALSESKAMRIDNPDELGDQTPSPDYA